MSIPLSLRCWLLLPVICLTALPVFAEDLPVAQQSCLYYQGEDPETLHRAAQQSSATKLGLKLGLMVRKRQAVQWVLAYQQGYADAQQSDLALPNAEQVTPSLDAYCGDHPDATLLQAVRALTNIAP